MGENMEPIQHAREPSWLRIGFSGVYWRLFHRSIPYGFAGSTLMLNISRYEPAATSQCAEREQKFDLRFVEQFTSQSFQTTINDDL
jgi:hypothetical protein